MNIVGLDMSGTGLCSPRAPIVLLTPRARREFRKWVAATALLFTFLFAPHGHSQDSPHGLIKQACLDCHTTASWAELASPMRFDHDTTTFPLRGEHRTIACSACHTMLRFTQMPHDCAACHKKDYDAAVSVNHRTAGFGTDCTECHDENAMSWLGSFDHDRTNFPTRGIHETLPCKACHANNRFKGTPIECASCHLQLYLTTSKPNHRSAGFPTDCGMCHQALVWQPAGLYPHPAFPISPGATHQPGVWNTCADCHADETNFSAFECINCHTHNRSATDSRHQGVSGYVYQSSACYHCHQSGGGGR